MGRFSVDEDSNDDSSSDEANDSILELRQREKKSSRSIQPASRNDNEGFTVRFGHRRRDMHVYGNTFKYDVVENRRSRHYLSHILIIIVLVLLQHYAPPPVPPFDTWSEYISHSTEGFTSTMKKMIVLGYYIGSGCLNNMKHDGIEKLNYLISRERHHESIQCPMLIPSSKESPDAIKEIRDHLMKKIDGQGTAMDSISRALLVWGTYRQSVVDDMTEGVHKHSRPMNVLLAGPDGVGKYETSVEVANLLLNGCKDGLLKKHCNCENACTEDNSRRLLSLEGVDFALEHSEEGLIRQILDHIYNQNGAGAVVLIRHVENLSLDSKLELTRLLSKFSVSFAPTQVLETNSFWKVFRVDEQDVKEHVDVRLDNCVFLLTTDLGSDKIFRGLKSFGLKDQVIFEKVHQAVEQDAMNHFSDSKVFDAVVPFWPLQHSDMKSILKRKLSTKSAFQRYSVEIEQSALDYLTGPTFVDYIEMKFAGWVSESGDDSGNVGSIVFSKRGGHDLQYNAIMKAIEGKLEHNLFHDDDEVVRLVHRDPGHVHLQICGNHADCFERGSINIQDIIMS